MYLGEVADADGSYFTISFGPFMGLVVPETITHCEDAQGVNISTLLVLQCQISEAQGRTLCI